MMKLFRLIICVLILALARIQQSIAYSRWHALDKAFDYRCNSFNQKDICTDKRRITIVDSIDSRSYDSRRLNRLNMVATRIPTIISSSNSNFITSTIRSLSSMINPAVSGGMLSGGLHAITGPDHLAALMGPSIGKPGYYGLRIGALWGLGHGFSALLLGSSAFYLKGQFTGRFAVLEKLANLAESAVGISILFIGLIGIKESNDAEVEEKNEVAGVVNAASNPTASSSSSTTQAYPRSSRAIFANGILHGLSWDGAPSLAPAITMASWKSALTFLLSYSIGTIITMSLAAGAVGELSLRVSKVTNNPDLPRKLSLVTSIMAVAIGVFFTIKSLHSIH